LKLKIKNIQEKLKQYDIEGWLFYDFHQINHLALTVLEISKDAFISRRFFYWVPQKGEPIKLTHKIEPHVLDQLPGKALTYNNLEHLKEQLKNIHQKEKSLSFLLSMPGLSR
jgi:Xaa-Pro dipeptidase